MVAIPADFLTDDDIASIDADAVSLFEETSLTRTITHTYFDSSAPEKYDSFAGTVAKVVFDEVVLGIRGHDRDSEAGGAIVGRYRYLTQVASYPLQEPSVDDLMTDGADIIQITAIRKSVGARFYLIEGAKVGTAAP